MKEQDYKILNSEEYAEYLKALCRLASQYVSRIRAQFANKAYDMYQNETVRRIVYAYGEQVEKLDAYRLREFRYACKYGVEKPEFLGDDCLNNAGSYGETIKMLFDIV